MRIKIAIRNDFEEHDLELKRCVYIRKKCDFDVSLILMPSDKYGYFPFVDLL